MFYIQYPIFSYREKINNMTCTVYAVCIEIEYCYTISLFIYSIHSLCKQNDLTFKEKIINVLVYTVQLQCTLTQVKVMN